jgi:hypothetical protein
MPSFGLPSARAEASRRNGAKSRGPKTPEGKARSARNALKHGLRAEKFVVLGDEDLDEFDALEAALMAELSPEGALQTVLARRIVAATWRLERAERMEAELVAQNIWGTTSFGLALIRDCNGARAFDTLLRYRGATLAELWRALRTLKALQAEQAAQEVREAARTTRPDEPERRRNPGDSAPHVDPVGADPALAWLPTWPFAAPPATTPEPAPGIRPIEPERRRNPGESVPQPAAEMAKNGPTSLLAGTALSGPAWLARLTGTSHPTPRGARSGS